MKKIVSVFLSVVLCFCLAGCDAGSSSSDVKVDLDLAKLSSTVVYAEVYNMMATPENYLGKTIRAKGMYSASFFEPTQKYYHYVIIADATACCSQGIEFLWEGHTQRTDFPEDGTEIEIVGVFDTYDELDVTYYYIDISSIEIKS